MRTTSPVNSAPTTVDSSDGSTRTRTPSARISAYPPADRSVGGVGLGSWVSSIGDRDLGLARSRRRDAGEVTRSLRDVPADDGPRQRSGLDIGGRDRSTRATPGWSRERPGGAADEVSGPSAGEKIGPPSSAGSRCRPGHVVGPGGSGVGVTVVGRDGHLARQRRRTMRGWRRRSTAEESQPDREPRSGPATTHDTERDHQPPGAVIAEAAAGSEAGPGRRRPPPGWR